MTRLPQDVVFKQAKIIEEMFRISDEEARERDGASAEKFFSRKISYSEADMRNIDVLSCRIYLITATRHGLN